MLNRNLGKFKHIVLTMIAMVAIDLLGVIVAQASTDGAENEVRISYERDANGKYKHPPVSSELKSTLDRLESKFGVNSALNGELNLILDRLKPKFDINNPLSRVAWLGEAYSDLSFEYHTRYLRAQTSYQMGDFEEAASEYKAVVGYAIEYYGPEDDFTSKVMNDLALAYSDLGDFGGALSMMNASLSATEKKWGEPSSQTATALNNIGTIYLAQGNFKLAIEYLEKAYKMVYEAPYQTEQELITAYANLADVYERVGDFVPALSRASRAAFIAEDHFGDSAFLTATALSKHAGVLSSMQRHNEAEIILDKALKIAQKKQSLYAREELGEIGVRLGVLYSHIAYNKTHLGKHKEGIKFCSLMLDNFEESVGINHSYYASGLRCLANANLAAGNVSNAYTLAIEALPLGLRFEQLTDLVLARVLYKQGNLSGAIALGKYAINNIQSVRSSNADLPPRLRKYYLASKADTFREVAEWMINSGRVTEALDVLYLIKEEEFSEYVRRRPGLGSTTELHYDAYENRISLLIEGLREIQDSNKPKEKVFLDDLKKRLKAGNTSVPMSSKYSQDLVREQSKLGEGSILINTLLRRNALYLIVTYKEKHEVFKQAIHSERFDEYLSAFREQLSNPLSSPKKMGRRLYEIIFSKLRKFIEVNNISDIIWSLDGKLQQIPMSALYDGEDYLVSSLNQSRFVSLLSDAQVSSLDEQSILGFGVTREKLIKLPMSKKITLFKALEFVKDELDSIVLESNEDPVGEIRGEYLLDEVFTTVEFERKLSEQRHSIVHIASHFSLGNIFDTQSFLLTGGNDESDQVLTVNEIKNSANFDMPNVNLLTLSACDTAVSGDGSSIDSFATLMNKKGALSVVASLWQVADRSTMRLMSKFYKNLAENNWRIRSSLRESQNDLIEIYPEYSHPFYWAPFIVIGRADFN